MGCFAGIRHVAVTSNGGVKACLSLPDSFLEGTIRERPLSAIWGGAESFAWNRDFKPSDLRGACTECHHGPLCRGGCTAMAVSAHGAPHQSTHCLLLTRSSGQADT